MTIPALRFQSDDVEQPEKACPEHVHQDTLPDQRGVGRRREDYLNLSSEDPRAAGLE